MRLVIGFPFKGVAVAEKALPSQVLHACLPEDICGDVHVAFPALEVSQLLQQVLLDALAVSQVYAWRFRCRLLKQVFLAQF